MVLFFFSVQRRLRPRKGQELTGERLRLRKGQELIRERLRLRKGQELIRERLRLRKGQELIRERLRNKVPRVIRVYCMVFSGINVHVHVLYMCTYMYMYIEYYFNKLDVLRLITVQVLKKTLKSVRAILGWIVKKWCKQIHVCPLNVLLLMNHLFLSSLY